LIMEETNDGGNEIEYILRPSSAVGPEIARRRDVPVVRHGGCIARSMFEAGWHGHDYGTPPFVPSSPCHVDSPSLPALY